MTPPSEPTRRYLDRFSRAEGAVHWITATLMIVCIVTAAVLYNGPTSSAISTVYCWWTCATSLCFRERCALRGRR
jgi:cytochrome b subunit of formate dehydrogenase